MTPQLGVANVYMYDCFSAWFTEKISLKVFVDNKRQKVLLAEGPEEFFDFLFHILSLPPELLGSKEWVGSLRKLKESLDNMDEMFLQPATDDHNIFFNPHIKIDPFYLPNDSPSIDAFDEEKKKKKRRYVIEGTLLFVMDDLMVRPMSRLPSLIDFEYMGVEDFDQLEVKPVSFGRDEMLKLLNASLTTDQVLTTVFHQILWSSTL